MARRGAVALAALALTAALGACGEDAGEGDGDPVLTVYVSAPLSGPARAEGRAVAASAREALADGGAEAGGVRVRVRVLDGAGRDESAFDPVSVADNARRAAEDSTTIAYVGERYSGATRTSLPILNEAGILQVAPGGGAADLVLDEGVSDDVPELVQPAGERTFAQLAPTYGPDDPARLPDPRAAGYEAMASILAAIDRAAEPTERDSVLAAYFDGSERDSPLGPYRITDTGEFEPLDD